MEHAEAQRSLAHPLVERLLGIMDRKHHWAYPALTRGGLTRSQLLVHFRHEYLVYVRDFPVLLARALGNVPPLVEVRRALAENLYEEQTGGLSNTGPHPELFITMMRGLGFSRDDFADDDESIHPAALAYRDFLLRESAAMPWQGAVALLTIFLEGSANERAELAGTFVRERGEEAVLQHPLVQFYGCPPEAMVLRRAHAEVEGDHRSDAWSMVLSNTQPGSKVEVQIYAKCDEALGLWLRYRDGVAERMGLTRNQLAATRM